MKIEEFKKLKVGDKVRIVSDNSSQKGWNRSMNKYRGKIMTVRQQLHNGSFVCMVEDKHETGLTGSGWFWFPHMIECKIEDEPTIVEHLVKGNKIIVKLSNGKVGVAACSPDDEFDMCEGLKLAIDRAYGKVPGFKKGAKKSAPQVKAVKRHAKVGEYIKIITPFMSRGCYEKGSILLVKQESGLYGGPTSVRCVIPNRTFYITVDDSEYVVLEGYEPEPKVKEVSRPANVGEYIKIIPSKFNAYGAYKPGDILKVYKVDLDYRGVYCELEKKIYKVHNHNGNLFIDNEEYVVLEGYEPETKEVKRKAKVGEYIKIVDPRCTFGDYGKGHIFKVESTSDMIGGVTVEYYGENCCTYIMDEEYVVLENCKPKKK